jgi:hypothetical protein
MGFEVEGEGRRGEGGEGRRRKIEREGKEGGRRKVEGEDRRS